MNVQEAIRRLNGYLQRRGTVNGSGGWTEQYLYDLLNDANLDMYHRVVNYGPEIFQTVSRFTYDANSADIDLNAKLSGLPMAIWYLGALPKDEDISQNNLPAQLQMLRRTNLDTVSSNYGVNSSTGFSSPYGNIDLPGSFQLGASTNYGAYQAYFLGKRLSLRPIPAQDTYMYIRWTPDALPPLVDEQDDLLGGFLPQFHPAIVYKAAIQAKSAKGEDTGQLVQLYQEIVGQFDSNLKMGCRQRQRQQPQQRDPMRWEF